MLYATVRQRKIHVKNPVTVIQNGIGVDWLVLDMDDEWKSMTSIVCVFTNGDTAREMLHTFGQPVQVPWECLKETGMLSVSCTGYVGSEKVMTTMLPDSFWNVVQNGPVTGDTPMEPTATLYEQVLTAAGAASAAATVANEIGAQLRQAYENGELNGESATVELGMVTTGEPGTEAKVTNTGTPLAAVLNFTLPRGVPGPAGERGATGQQGPIGRGIKDIYANSDGSWTFVYTDDRTVIVSNDAYEASIAAANAGASAAYNAANMANQQAGRAAEEADYAERMGLYAASAGNTAVNAASNADAALDELRTARENGEFNGEKGDKGDPGHTPVKGVDFFTPEELEALSREAADVVDGEIDSLNEQIRLKADNLFFDANTNLLYLTSNGEIVGDGVAVSVGGGSGSSTNNAVMTLKNTSGWNYKIISEGGECPISFAWSSLEDELETGNGLLKITVNGSTKHTAQIDQGDRTMDIGPMLTAGDNTVKVNVSDVYGNSRTLNYTLKAVSLKLESSFDGLAAYTGDIAYFYVPTAAVEKTVYFKLDGEIIGTQTITVSGRQQNFTIPAPGHGCHSFEVYYTAVIDGVEVPSNHLYYSLICVEEGNTTPIIATTFRGTTAEQYDTVSIPYRVYDPASLTAAIELATSESADVKPLTVDRTEQMWSYMPETAGELTLSISCGTKVLMIGLTVTEATIEVETETENLSLHLTSYGRSNNEADPSVWQHGDIVAELENFNFTSDGWVQDEDGITVLRISGDARVTIPAELFKNDFRTSGKTIEIEFASRNVLNYDTEIMNCWSGERGFAITAQQALMKSEQSSAVIKYKEDEHLRLSFVVEKRSGNRLLLVYINGVVSGMLQYPDDDDFSQTAPVGIRLGSNDCTTDIYNIRVYDNDLTRYQILDNWIADTQVMAEKKDRYDRNDIYDDYGQILPTTLRSHQKYLIIEGAVLPQSKGDKKTVSGSFVDPVDGRGFTFTGAEIDVQGTSSQYYYVKNYKIKFKNGFTLENGTTAETYALNEQAVPVSEFTFKADVASSEGANNVVLAKLYNEVCPVKTPAQEKDARVRQTIDGFPIVVFHDDGTGPKFIGKYNFNNDKGTAETFGFAAGDESWEILENGNDMVSFKSADFSGDGWKTSFGARFPEDNVDTTKLAAFSAWVASTDTDAVSTEEQKASRLQKFRNELADHADVQALIFYYVFTELFLCIDQREKNAFPTWYKDLGKWMMLFYDADSSIGTDNKGNLAFDYWLEDIDCTEAGDPVFNGQNSVLWVNLRKCFADEIKAEYQRLRTEVRADGRPLLSYDVVNEMFEQHQGQWSEAIYNEDAWRKAVEPLEQGDAQYLPMQQGKKEHHFKWWMYNRFRYLDGKYETGDSMNDRIMIRAHAQANVKLTGYANMYGRVYYNADCDTHRMTRGVEQEFEWKATGAEDAVIGINDAALLTSIGDLAPLMSEDVNIAGATHLTSLKVGDGAADYVNDNLTALTLGNNRLLKTLDVRNCTALTQAVDASGCQNIEEVYFDNTAITGLSLPNGGILKKLHLPETLTNLTIRNQTKLTEFVMPGYGNITTLRLENVSAAVPGAEILAAVPANSRVRLIGFDWTMDSAEAALALYDRLDTMRGLDENGGNMDKAQMQGTIRVDSILGSQLADMQSRYPDISVIYQHITSSLYFYDETGETLLYTASCTDGADGVYGGSTPVKASTAQYHYGFAGWSLTPGGSADADALKAVTADRNVYAAYTATVRTYTVKWYNGDTLLETDTNVPYGTVPAYNGADPVYDGDYPDNYEFDGWSPKLEAVTRDITYTAAWRQKGYIYVALLERTLSGAYTNTEVTKAGLRAFAACNNLTSLTLPAATVIDSAVYECDSLTKLDLHAATSIGVNTGYLCGALKTLILRSETMCEAADQLVFATVNSDRVFVAISGLKIYVPRALVSSYNADTNWTKYCANKFRALEDYTVDGTITGALKEGL